MERSGRSLLVRDLPHPPAKVWKALTDPEHLREWAPFDSDRNLGTVGTAKLTTVGAPTPHVTETEVKRADAPKVLEFSWGGQDIRWELEPLGGGGTRLTLWHNIDRGFISMGAAGWHICFDVLDRYLAGRPIGRIVGPEAMKSRRLAAIARRVRKAVRRTDRRLNSDRACAAIACCAPDQLFGFNVACHFGACGHSAR